MLSYLWYVSVLLSVVIPRFHSLMIYYVSSCVLSTNQVDQEREGEQIDRALLKNVLDIFVEIGMGQMDHYDNDFEAAMLNDTAAYYSRKASNWILEDSCPDYMLKVCICMTNSECCLCPLEEENTHQDVFHGIKMWIM